MQTDSQEYDEFLERRYLPGRGMYLDWVVFPQYLRELVPGEVCDFGCGMGAFLEYCRKRGVPATGIDSSPYMIRRCRAKGLKAEVDDITRPATVSGPVRNIVCDNVLEHLPPEKIRDFFQSAGRLLQKGGVLLVIVPNRKGFASDPTHVTFVDRLLVEPLAVEQGLVVTAEYRLPIRWQALGERFIYNMTVMRLTA